MQKLLMILGLSLAAALAALLLILAPQTSPLAATADPAPAPLVDQPNGPNTEPKGNQPSTPAAPAPTWEKAADLEASVRQALADFTGQYSLVVHDLSTGNQWSLNPEQWYHPASTIKLPVTLYALEEYRAGRVGWQDLIQYTPADFESPGGGAFETAPFGGLYPIENLVNRSLIYSNNVAVNMLGRHFGWRNIEAWTKSIDGELARVDGSPQVTPLSELGWWLHLYHLSQVDPQNARLLLAPLEQVEYESRITAGLPPGTPHVHKFGSYAGNDHDGGLILTENPYIIIVMTYGASDPWEADQAIANATAAVHQVMAMP